jgi:hypothetical protein
MPLKKDEMEERELRRQVSQQNAQKRGDAQEWDDIRSHRKDKKDDVWDKSNKYKEHMAKPKYRKKEGGMAEYEVPKSKQAKMRKAADDAETDRKMQEAMEKHKKTRVGGGKKEDKPKMAKGGRVAQAVQAMRRGKAAMPGMKVPMRANEAPGRVRSDVMPGRATLGGEPEERGLAEALRALSRGEASGRMAKGGAVAKPKAKAYAKGGEVKMARGGEVKMARGGMTKMARGGEVKMARGGMTKMARGGKVRGCGIAKQGVRKAKMY